MSNLKKIEEQIFKVIMAMVTWSIILVLFYILFVIFRKGLPALSWEMVSQVPKGGFYFGKEGGILNAIVGSLYLAMGSTLIAMCISIPVALGMNVYLVRHKKLLQRIRFWLDSLWGIPTVVYGAFGYTLMSYMGMRSSLLAGIITLSLVISPIMIRAMDEVIRSIHIGLMETSLSLGLTKAETAFKVYLRQALSGTITAVILAFGRAIGDTASVLFTAGYTDVIPTKLSHPTASLPLSIFFQLGSPIDEVKARAYAAAVVLTMIVLIVSLSARIISGKYKKQQIK